MPPAVFSSASMRRTRTRSCSGRNAMMMTSSCNECCLSWHSPRKSANGAAYGAARDGRQPAAIKNFSGGPDGSRQAVRGAGQAMPGRSRPSRSRACQRRSSSSAANTSPAARPEPHADPAQRGAEAEPRGKPEARHPVGEQRDPHRDAGILEPAQHARAHHLQPVEQLEAGADHQVGHGEGDDRAHWPGRRDRDRARSASAARPAWSMAVSTMKPAPIAIPAQPDWRTPTGLRAPK